MWQVVFIANTKEHAERIRDHLIGEGFLIKLQPMGKDESAGYQLLAPEGEASEIVEVINENY